jgi:hypothetical protein
MWKQQLPDAKKFNEKRAWQEKRKKALPSLQAI